MMVHTMVEIIQPFLAHLASIIPFILKFHKHHLTAKINNFLDTMQVNHTVY